MTRAEIIESIQAAQELLRRRAAVNYSAFVMVTKPDYDMQWFHKLTCDKLGAFERGEIRKLMVWEPPQHGKSQLTTRQFPPYLVGRNPKRQVGVVSYNDSMAKNFNRAIQRIIDTPEYLSIFPNTKINNSQLHSEYDSKKVRNTEILDILGNGNGSIKTLGRGGSLTGFPLDIGILDDLIKDREEANSLTVREQTYNWYTDVFKTRLHNGSQQLYVTTRWHEHDLAGRLMMEENDWEVIILPAIKTADIVPYDPREVGEALWPEKHSLEKLRAVERTNKVTFKSLYQQQPGPPDDVLIYTDWIEVVDWPEEVIEYSWGLDFGKTTGINALVRCAMTGQKTKRTLKVNREGRLVEEEVERYNAYLKEYLYAPNIPPKEIAKILYDNGYMEGQVVWCDHIPTKIQELRDLGIAAIAAVKGPGSVSAGIDKMHEYQIYFTGKNLREEARTYQYVTYGPVITNIPAPNQADHLLDAARYGLLSRFFYGV